VPASRASHATADGGPDIDACCEQFLATQVPAIECNISLWSLAIRRDTLGCGDDSRTAAPCGGKIEVGARFPIAGRWQWQAFELGHEIEDTLESASRCAIQRQMPHYDVNAAAVGGVRGAQHGQQQVHARSIRIEDAQIALLAFDRVPQFEPAPVRNLAVTQSGLAKF